jgi:hypothetical protein
MFVPTVSDEDKTSAKDDRLLREEPSKASTHESLVIYA